MAPKKRFGLIIQGPLTSFGRGGDKAHLPTQDFGEDGLVRMDCRENIRRIVENFGGLFDVIVISTWDGEVKPGDGWPGAIVSTCPDPGGIKSKSGGLYTYKDNNKYRQFVSTYNGITEIEKQAEVDYVIKIRSDQYVDLQKMINTFLQMIDKEECPEQLVFAPYLQPATFLLHDFYFAASFRALKAFCEAILSFDRFEFIDSVHREMVLKHAYVCYRDRIGVPNWAYFPHSPANGVSAPTRRIFSFMFKNVYRSLGEDVLRSVLWRESFFSEEYLASRLHPREFSSRRMNLPSLACIDWRRYYAFLKQTEGRPIGWKEKSVIRGGMLSWNGWQKLRRIVQRVKGR